MVGRQSQAVCGASGKRARGAGWIRACADRSRLCAKAVSVEDPAVHPRSAREPAGGMELFRESCALIPAPVHRVDRFRQATGNEEETAAGGHWSARGGQETWLEMMWGGLSGLLRAGLPVSQAPTIHCPRVLCTTLSHSAAAKCNPALMQKFVENRLRAVESAGFPPSAALQEESPLGGCAAGVANLGGGSHPVAQASLDIPLANSLSSPVHCGTTHPEVL